MPLSILIRGYFEKIKAYLIGAIANSNRYRVHNCRCHGIIKIERFDQI